MGERDTGAVVDRGSQNPARDVIGAAAPLSLARATSGEGGWRWQSRRSPGTLSRSGPCHMSPCVEAESAGGLAPGCR